MQKTNYLFKILAALVILISIAGMKASAQNKQDDGRAQNITIDLTQEEKIFIKSHPVIRFGTDYRWEPYAIKNADGTIEGFDVDLINYINERAGTNIQVVVGRWAEIVEQAKDLKIDGLSTSSASKERGLFFNFSKPYTSLFPVFVVAGDSNLKINGIDNFAGKSVAILKGNQFYLNLLGKYPSINIIESPSEIDAIKLTIEGKADAAIVATTFYNNYNKIFGKDIKIGYVATNDPLEIVYSVRKDWPELVSIINKVLKSLSEETKNSLFYRWFGFSPADFDLSEEEEFITPTAHEKEWIKAHPEIRLGVDPAWQPTEFVDQKGQHQGISSDYVRILNNRLGLNMKIVPNLSWAQVMDAALQKGVDVLPGVAITPEREKYLNYTEPYLYIDWVIMSRKETPKISGLSDLEGRLTAVDQGSSTHGRLKNQYPEIPLLLQATTLDCLQSVNEGRAEATVVELTAATFILQAYNINSLKIDSRVFQKNDTISFAVRNDWPELVQILNKGLASITPDERERIRDKWLAVPIEIGFTKMDMLRIVFSVFAVMGIFLVFSLFWNRRLKKEMHEKVEAEKERKRAEEALIESDEKYSKAFQTSPYAITITEPKDGKIIEVNDAFISITGFSREETLNNSSIGMNLWVNEEDRQKVVSDLSAGRAVAGQECLFRTKNGKVITGLFSAQLLNLRQGPCILSSINDITQRKSAEKELALSEERYRTIMEQAADAVFMHDETGRIVDANQKACQNLGYSREELLSMSIADFDPEAIKTGNNEIWDKLATNEHFTFESHHLRKDGSLFPVEVTLGKVELKTGPAVLGIVRDITERKRFESKLQQSQKMESIGNLAGGIAHDFNNILSSIIGFTELTLDEVEKGSVAEDNLQEIYSAGMRAKDLVKQILTFARQSDDEIKPIQPDFIAKEVIQLIRSSIPTTIEIKQNIQSNSLIMGNATQIHQIFMNLCTNAAHSMEDDGGILGVEMKDITVDRATSWKNLELKPGPYIKIAISDTGSGIEPGIIQKIFEPYFTTKGPGEGTGMGLAMVHGIVEGYGGKIYVDSTVGVGTTFTIYLPITRKRGVQNAYEPEALPTGTERVLFVDDEISITKIGSKVLSQLGYSVTTKQNSMEALELFRSKPQDFDLVISDMTMPNMTGDKLAFELMNIRADIPVILFTGYSKKMSEQTASDSGIKAFAYKPIVKVDLAKTVRKVLDAAK